MDALNGQSPTIHPFFPPEANIVGYLANDYSIIQLLSAFATGCVVLLGGTLLLTRQRVIRLSGKDEAVLIWFVLCMIS